MIVAVAMSGGVDSLRAACLLKEQGHEVLGIHMRHLPESGGSGPGWETATAEPEKVLESVASRLGIPLSVVDLRADFETWVVAPFVQAYRQGRTPNPCVLCNPKIKFGLLLEAARSLGAERFATGHYARVVPPASSPGRFHLVRARDMTKDQSYFLYGLSQEQLAFTLFPLGATTKQDVLRWAEAQGLTAVLSRESQEICFIPSGNYHEFLKGRSDLTPASSSGPILDREGNPLGEHKGIYAFTIGQRRGLGIASTAPYYVVSLDAGTNTVRVGRVHDLYRRECAVHAVNWVSIACPESPLRARVRIRNQHLPAPALVTPVGSAEASVRFDEPQRAVTAGQAAVFYDGDRVLGGGTIA